MVSIDMSKVGKRVEVGTYPVILTSVKEKPATGRTKGDIITFVATIKDSGTEWDGSPLTRTFFINSASDADNGATFYYLFEAIVAFSGDEDEIAVENFNPVKYAKENLIGQAAVADVVHNVSRDDPEKVYVNTTFKAPGSFS